MGSRESPKSQDHNGLHDLEDVEDILELNQGTEGQEAAMGSWVLVGEKDLEQTEVTGDDVIFPKKEHVDCEETADGYLMVNIDRGQIKKEEEKKTVTNSNGKTVDSYEEDIETEKGILIAGRNRTNNEDIEVKLCKDFAQKLHEDYFPAAGIGSVQKEGNTGKYNEKYQVCVEEMIKRFKKQEVEEKEKTNQFRKGLYQKESTSLIGNGGSDSLKEFHRSKSYEERRFIESRVAQLKREVSLLEKKISGRKVPKNLMEMEMQDYIIFLMECCCQSIKSIIELLKNDAPIEQIERQIRHLEEQVEDLRSTLDSELLGNKN